MKGIWLHIRVSRLRIKSCRSTWHWCAVALICANLLAVEGRAAHAQTATPEAFPAAGDAVLVSPYLTAELAGGAEHVAILVVLRDQLNVAAFDAAFDAAARAGNATLVGPEAALARRTAIYHQLTAHALASQADLRAWLDAQGIPYRAHYLINMISVSGDAALVAALRQRSDVARLDANPLVNTLYAADTYSNMTGGNASMAWWTRPLNFPEAAASPISTASPASPNTPYGVAATHAPEVWAMGYTGQGIVVASQDTGVQWDHPALVPHYRGAQGGTVDHTYNWLDASPDTGSGDACAGLSYPCDDNGHGTHTVGTMVGTSSVITYGVAPGAQWMGCRNMRNGVGRPESYTTCFEFFLAPYPPGGDPFTDGRPELAPNIINNSWGCPDSEFCSKDALRQVVETVRAAGVMVVSSAGNNGISCQRVEDPIAIYDATFTVGAVDASGNLANFSSRGPVTVDGSGRIKPDITAPGVGVLSTYRFSTTTTLSGTSMAAPHVAGAVALLWSAAAWLIGDVDMTEQVLLKSATPVYSDICGATSEPVSPNNGFGYGMLDAAAAVEMALQPWAVTVAVTGEDHAPLAGVGVTWIDARTGYTYTATTDLSGTAIISPTLAGTYTLQVQGDAGVEEIDAVDLVNDGAPGTLHTLTLDVRYDEQISPYPSHHYMPGIMLNKS